MDFYGRASELEILEKLWVHSTNKARMAVITGRRRVGKTLLSMVYVKDKPHLYLFVAKKSEALLCEEFVQLVKNTFDVPILGQISSFKDVFHLLLEIAKTKQFVLIIDEVQEFLNINPAVFSDMQKLWDQYLFQSKIELVLMGSISSLMEKIFEDSHEPLFGRADRILRLKPFTIHELSHIIEANGHGHDMKILFSYYLFTGGVPKYVEQLLVEKAFQEKDILQFIFSENSPFLNEGKHVLVEEFGKEYGMYFSILELIASGKTSRSEMESVLQKDIGGYLDRLENFYSVIQKYRPIHAKPQTRMVRYRIQDQFLKFWFRFMYREWTAIETANFSYVLDVVNRDLQSYKGVVLEDFFKGLFQESKQFNEVGSYWESDNSKKNDLVAINDLQKRIVIAEVKVTKEKIRLNALKTKAQSLLRLFPDYTPEYLALSLDDAKQYVST